MFALPESLLKSKALARLRNTCYSRIGVISSTADPGMLQQLLVTVFGNVPAIITSSYQLHQFCLLPLTAVLVWAKADTLKVHSENCVVLLLSAWNQAREVGAAAAVALDAAAEAAAAAMHSSSDDDSDYDSGDSDEDSDDEDLTVSRRISEELAHCVRVLQLSPLYLQHIMPSLPWFRGCSGINYLPRLQFQKSAGLDVDVQGDWAGPPSWLADARMSADHPCMEWVVKAAELELLPIGRLVSSPSVYMNGAFFKCGLQQDPAAPWAVILRVQFEAVELIRVSGFSSGIPLLTAAKAAVTILHPAGNEHARKCVSHKIYSWPGRPAHHHMDGVCRLRRSTLQSLQWPWLLPPICLTDRCASRCVKTG